ncbi:MAG: DUF2236 domain-containing protein [Acidimicrobiia bacterium]|nr:DUF2236 domain-containing protein [Acidimicrobiia bacterium]
MASKPVLVGRADGLATLASVDEALAPVARRLNAERLVLLAWPRAILLQLAHPLVAAGVFDHSSFRGGPSAAATRLRATVRAMLSLTFGTTAQRQQTLDSIRGIHRRVHGHLSVATGRFPAGTPYSTKDPALLLWVHATLLDSIPLVYERTVGPLSADERNRYCLESAAVAVALGARDRDVPRTWNELNDYLTGMYASGAIAVGHQARELAYAVLRPPLSALIAPVTTLNRVVTVGTLPRPIREQYGFTWSERHDRRLTTVFRMLAALRRQLPDRLAHWPEARRARSNP